MPFRPSMCRFGTPRSTTSRPYAVQRCIMGPGELSRAPHSTCMSCSASRRASSTPNTSEPPTPNEYKTCNIRGLDLTATSLERPRGFFYAISPGPTGESDPEMYVCSKCKGPLVDYKCARCRLEFSVLEGVPCFLTESAGGGGQRLREIYDDIYRHHEDVWIDQGRSQEFLGYLCKLAQSSPNDSVLEIGCGEGRLLAALTSVSKYGIDPSIHALVRARKRSTAECAVARAEELPFPHECRSEERRVGKEGRVGWAQCRLEGCSLGP